MIFYKVNQDSQLLYKNTKATTSCVTVLDDEFIVTGSETSSIDLWSLKKKKPIFRV
jgi:ribosomal RNA-processing protein 9